MPAHTFRDHLISRQMEERIVGLSIVACAHSADVADFASHILAQSGFPEEAIPLSKKAIALNPNHPPVYLGSLGQEYRLAGRTEEAIPAFRAFDARSPGFGLIGLVIIYQEKGEADDAQQTAKLSLTARPNFIASRLKTPITPRYGAT
jgi:tetratricopeptide (TPR) repeat protein